MRKYVNVTKIPKLKDTNPGDILKKLPLWRNEYVNSQSKEKNKNHHKIRHNCINLHQIKNCLYLIHFSYTMRT
jgi:hypothetical protein